MRKEYSAAVERVKESGLPGSRTLNLPIKSRMLCH